MKFIYLLLPFFLFACSSSSNEEMEPEKEKPTFEAPNDAIAYDLMDRFDNINIIKWTEKNGYHVATLLGDQKTKTTSKDTVDTWYKPDGKCELVNIQLGQLPANISELVKGHKYYSETARIVNADFCERPQGTCYKVVYLLNDTPPYFDAVTVFCSQTEVLSEMLEMDVDSTFTGYESMVPLAKEAAYIEERFPEAMILQVYPESNDFNPDVTINIVDCLVDDLIVSIEFDIDSTREYTFLKFSQLPQTLRDALLKLDSSLNDENCEAERVYDGKKTVYHIDSSNLGGTYDENGNKIQY